MQFLMRAGVLAVVCLALPVGLQAQESGSTLDSESVREGANDLVGNAQETVDDLARQVDASEQAGEISAGILQPIYRLAEAMAFPSFYWVAFMLMVTGVVSYALQLVLGKLVVLSKLSMSVKEILADGLGLAISLIGLVLTTQAAAENSTFTESPAAVLSAAGAGAVLGLIFCGWGMKEEIQAARGRKIQSKD